MGRVVPGLLQRPSVPELAGLTCLWQQGAEAKTETKMETLAPPSPRYNHLNNRSWTAFPLTPSLWSPRWMVSNSMSPRITTSLLGKLMPGSGVGVGPGDLHCFNKYPGGMDHSLKKTDLGGVSNRIRKEQGGRQRGRRRLNSAAKDLGSSLHVSTCERDTMHPPGPRVDVSTKYKRPAECTASKRKLLTHPLR